MEKNEKRVLLLPSEIAEAIYGDGSETPTFAVMQDARRIEAAVFKKLADHFSDWDVAVRDALEEAALEAEKEAEG